VSRRSKNQDLIDDLARWMDAPDQGKAQTNGHAKAVPNAGFPGPTDKQIIEKCRAAVNAARFSDLFDHGDTSANDGDASGADFALLGILKYYTQDPDQLVTLMRLSALARPKWDENRAGRTWLRYSIDNALKDVGKVYDWSKEGNRLLSSSLISLGKFADDDNNEDDLDGIVWFSEQDTPKEREYLIESVAVKKYTMVAYGAGGVAKSFAVLAAGIAIAGGVEKWLGLSVLDHGYVLYLDFELDAEEQHRRVRDLCAGMGVKIPQKLAYLSALGMTTEQAFKKAQAFVKKHGAKAVIIDSMGLAMAGDMDRAKDVIAFHRQFTDPLRALGTTPFVVDHEGKLQAGENRKEKGPTGSAFKSWTTRSVLQFILEEYDEANSALDIRVRQHKTNFKPAKPFGVRFTFGEKKVSIETIDLLDTELIDEAYVPVKERIVATLKPGEATIRELVALTGAETGTIRNKLSELKNEERVIDAGYRGREKLYALPDKDSSLLSSSQKPYRESGVDDNEPQTVSSLFASPPEWLPKQLEKYREDPQKHIGPLCTAVAAMVLGDGLRAEEVREEVERELASQEHAR
jgi:AAA domain